MQIAKRVYLLAQERNDSAVMIGACLALACTFYFLGDFESAGQYATHGIQIWRSGNVQSHPEDVDTPVVSCLCYGAMCKWHLGEIASCQGTIAEAISLAKELNDTHALAIALNWAAILATNERNPAEVDRMASDLIELSTRHNFLYFLALGAIQRGWARCASGNTAEGIVWMENGIRDYRATGSMLRMPYFFALKAEALHLADRTFEALEAINEAEAVADRFEQRADCAELHRLRGVLLANTGADEAQIDASFRAAIRTAKEQKSISLAKRAEASCAEYRHRKKESVEGVGFGQLPLLSASPGPLSL